MGKNAELEKARAQGKYMKPFETDILKLRADELNYTLCMFVKEVRKPNGEPYASDSILYLTLGIQGEFKKHYWYFVSIIVLTFCEKINVLVIKNKVLQIRGWRPRIYSSSERSEQFQFQFVIGGSNQIQYIGSKCQNGTNN